MDELRHTASTVGSAALTIKSLKKEHSWAKEDVPDPDLIKTWYKLDENNIPPVYRLQNIR